MTAFLLIIDNGNYLEPKEKIYNYDQSFSG